MSPDAARGACAPPRRARWQRGQWGERSLWTASFAATVLGVSSLFFIVWFIAVEAAPAARDVHQLWGLLVARPWEPLAEPPSYGILHAWVSTLMVTLIALMLAVPAALGVALFAAEIAPPGARNLLQPCLELLAGIPSVVYGFFGVVTLVPWFEARFDMATGECILVAALILAVMVLPFVASTAAEAMRSVPGALREAAYALGITRWHMVSRVVLRRAAPGLFAAVALGLARAIGEALAVLILTGNSTAVPESPFDRGQPITALILTELGEAGVGSQKYHVLFAAGAVLMGVIVAINLVIWSFKRRMLSTHG